MTFEEYKESTAKDCEAIAKKLTDLAAEVRLGNMAAFEAFWLEEGTEEGDAKIMSIRDTMILRFLYKKEVVAGNIPEAEASKVPV